MKVYKFRAAKDINFALDIIVNSRFFCAPLSTLNDYLEGVVPLSVRKNIDFNGAKFLPQFSRELQNVRVCSFTEGYENPLLWVHYANSFDGFAIEVDIPDEDLWPVEYNHSTEQLIELAKRLSGPEFARAVLSRKAAHWSYEREHRIICPFEFYRPPQPISRIIIGQRTADPIVVMLKTLAEELGVPIGWLSIGDDGELIPRSIHLIRPLGTNELKPVPVPVPAPAPKPEPVPWPQALIGMDSLGAILRAARPEEAEVLGSILVVSMLHSMEAVDGLVLQQAHERFLRMFNPQETQVIEVNGHVVGIVGLRLTETYLLLDHLSVVPSGQGRGIEAKLLQSFLLRASKHRREVRVAALKDSRANIAYIGCGFVLTHSTDRENYYVHKPTDA